MKKINFTILVILSLCTLNEFLFAGHITANYIVRIENDSLRGPMIRSQFPQSTLLIEATFHVVDCRDSVTFLYGTLVEELGIMFSDFFLTDPSGKRVDTNRYTLKRKPGYVCCQTQENLSDYTIHSVYGYAGYYPVLLNAFYVENGRMGWRVTDSTIQSKHTGIYIFGGTSNFNRWTDLFPESGTDTPIEYQNLTLRKDTSYYIFSSLEKVSENTKLIMYRFDEENKKHLNENLIVLLDKQLFEKSSPILLSSNITLTGYKPYSSKNDFSYVSNTVKNSALWMDFFDKINYSDSLSLNAVFFDWRSSIGASGTAFGKLLMMDTAFLRMESFFHELLHLVLPLQVQDSGRYLIHESMIEYVTQYLSCEGNPELLEKEFTKNRFKKEDTVLYSIYEVTENANSTFPIVYHTGPRLIYELAREVGFSKFWDLLTSFYREYLHKKEVVRYVDFINYLYDSKINPKAVAKFDDRCRNQRE